MSMYDRGGRRELLFTTTDGFDAMQARTIAAMAEVEGMPEQRILNTDEDALVRYFVEKFGGDVPVLDRENMVATHHERPYETVDLFENRRITVPGEAYDFELPFSGDPAIFVVRPNQFDFNPPAATVSQQVLRFTIAGRALPPEAVKNSLDELLGSIEQYLGWHRQMWATHTPHLENAVRRTIGDRRARLTQQKGAAATLATLGIKIREKPGDARTYVAPAVKQKIQPRLPPMTPAAAPEPTLDQAVYDSILGLIRDAGRSIEQSSSRARALDEEALRDMLLVPLNAHFGNATGEAFNVTGKTDILIRHEASNLFVAECKFWGGEKLFQATIDQLLGYLSWRDTKAAIVIFNRNVGFSAVVDKMREAAKTHAAFVSGPVRLDETSDRYTFALPYDSSRHVTISMLAFDLGVKA